MSNKKACYHAGFFNIEHLLEHLHYGPHQIGKHQPSNN